MQGERRGALLVVGVLAISAILGGIYGPPVRATSSDVNNLQDTVKTFTSVLSVVQKNYAVPVDTDHAIFSGAIPGMLRVLDPHSSFFDPRAYAALREDQSGHYFGVGMTIVPRDNYTYVLAPMPGAPAFRAGIRPGDVIMSVDGKSAEGLSSSQVADLLKGPKGTIVHVTMKRVGYAKDLNFTITRDEIPKHSVDIAFQIKPGIGYIKLTGFNETTDSELTAALNSLDAPKLDGLILDLRGNPGGLLNEAVAVADKFLDKNQLIVSHHGRASQERRYYAVHGNRGDTMPLVVIVNGGSASASEIVTGAIQDHDRGLVVGTRSFGKGLVQTVSGLSDNTGLALTTARYYTPSGRLIQRDYKDTTLYDYLYNHNNPPVTEIKLTDSGRQVTGGGGITPDVVVAPAKMDTFQETLLQRNVFFGYEGGVGGFTTYFLGTRPMITKDFVADANVMKLFTNYLDMQKIKYTSEDISQNLPWIKREIKKEAFISVFGLTEGEKVGLDDDVQIEKAIASLPQARALYENARRIIAQRTASTMPHQQ
ncbi:MAG TPA: S41 family peptidase [Candidatus Dormibacteraeota bacterium]|nr:S41 family peptidase [Candidatus Dormibacteraeota bacterium]